jgi:hypothetical protein
MNNDDTRLIALEAYTKEASQILNERITSLENTVRTLQRDLSSLGDNHGNTINILLDFECEIAKLKGGN